MGLCRGNAPRAMLEPTRGRPRQRDGLPVRRRNAETHVKPHFGVMPLSGKTAVAQQRGRRPPQILAARGSPLRGRGRPRVGSGSGPPVRRRYAETRVQPQFGQNAARRQNSRSSATRETTPANPGCPGQPIAMARSLAGRLNHPVLRVCAADTVRREAAASNGVRVGPASVPLLSALCVCEIKTKLNALAANENSGPVLWWTWRRC